MQVTDWVSIYQALVNTAALGVAALIYTGWVRQKNAPIDNLQTQIEHWKTQSVTAVHQANEALRKEIAVLREEAVKERELLENEKKEVVARLRQLETDGSLRAPLPPNYIGDLESNFNRLIASPPSERAANRLKRLVALSKLGDPAGF